MPDEELLGKEPRLLSFVFSRLISIRDFSLLLWKPNNSLLHLSASFLPFRRRRNEVKCVLKITPETMLSACKWRILRPVLQEGVRSWHGCLSTSRIASQGCGQTVVLWALYGTGTLYVGSCVTSHALAHRCFTPVLISGAVLFEHKLYFAWAGARGSDFIIIYLSEWVNT